MHRSCLGYAHESYESSEKECAECLVERQPRRELVGRHALHAVHHEKEGRTRRLGDNGIRGPCREAPDAWRTLAQRAVSLYTTNNNTGFRRNIEWIVLLSDKIRRSKPLLERSWGAVHHVLRGDLGQRWLRI